MKMDRNIRIAREIVRMARLLVAGQENFGHYSVEFDKAKRVFTVYFILKEDAVESEALKNAKACRYEIKSLLEKDGLIEVTNIENNERSFCFTIVVEKEDKENVDEKEKKSSFGWRRVLVADGDDDDSGDDGGDDSGDDGGDDDSDGDDSGDDGGDDSGDDEKKEEQVDPEELARFQNIQDTVKRICRKYNWDTGK